jgi:hypothetical protein
VRLRLSELERARKRPKAVAAAQFQPGKGIRPTFGGYWVLAARLYHKLFKMNDALCVQKAHDYFLQHCRAKLMNRANFDHEIALYSGRLDDYIADYLTLNQPVVQTNKRVQFKKITGHFVSGAIGRLDMIPAGGFAATNFELKASDWKSQLRTPIIQQAIADELNRPSSEIRVGMYCIASGNHEYVTLSAADIQQAIAELENVLNTVETEVKRLKRSKP